MASSRRTESSVVVLRLKAGPDRCISGRICLRSIRGLAAVRYSDDVSNRVNLPELLTAAAASIRHGILIWRVICPLASQ